MSCLPRRALALAPLVLLPSCGSGPDCDAPVAPADCPDIVFQGRSYDEWRTYRPPKILQEIGNANYPACHQPNGCDGLGGYGTTDVWQLGRVPPETAVLGLREGTHTYVVFVAVGTDPSELGGRMDERRLG